MGVHGLEFVRMARKGVNGYLRKFRGERVKPNGFRLDTSTLREAIWALIGSALGIGVCGYLSAKFFEPREATLILGSFGASAVLVYGVVRSPLSQPRNLVGGHLISALIGVGCQQFVGVEWLAGALAVSLSLVAMVLSDTMHPPGGATALIAVIGGPSILDLGYFYVLMPVGAGAVILLLIAVAVNNLAKDRRYPERWL